MKPLAALGLPVSESTLEFGDIAFQGRGTKGVSIDVGVEFKQLEELIASLRSGRFVGHQMPGMRAAYDHSWLLIEGDWRVNSDGVVCVVGRHKALKPLKPVKPRMTADELEKQLLTIQFLGGINVRFTRHSSDSLRFLCSLYRWFTDTDMDSHKSHLALYQPAALVPVSDFCRIVRGIDGVGQRVALAAEKKWGPSVRRAINARPAEWAALSTLDDKGKPRRVGEKLASKIDKILEGI